MAHKSVVKAKHSHKPKAHYKARLLSQSEKGVIVPSSITKAIGFPPLVRGEKGFNPLFCALVDELQPTTFSQGVIVYEIAHLTLLSRRFRRADAGLLEGYDTFTDYTDGDPDLPDFLRAGEEPPKRERPRVVRRRMPPTHHSLGTMLSKNIDVIERNHALLRQLDLRRDQLLGMLRREQRSRTYQAPPVLDLNAVETEPMNDKVFAAQE
jgi:hypothetical protein